MPVAQITLKADGTVGYDFIGRHGQKFAVMYSCFHINTPKNTYKYKNLLQMQLNPTPNSYRSCSLLQKKTGATRDRAGSKVNAG